MVEVTCKNRSDEVRQTLRLSTAKAGQLVHINTDRRVYRPGEPILLRAVILDRVTRLPLKHITDFEVKLLDARDGQLRTVVGAGWRCLDRLADELGSCGRSGRN